MISIFDNEENILGGDKNTTHQIFSFSNNIFNSTHKYNFSLAKVESIVGDILNVKDVLVISREHNDEEVKITIVLTTD